MNLKRINGFEDYYFNEDGDIVSLHKRNQWKILKKRIDRAGYYTVRLCKNGMVFTKFLHRLIAEHFIPNPENKKFVNHQNGNKLDNSPVNLEWVSHSENVFHGYQTGLSDKTKKETPVIDINSHKEFRSIKDAAIYYRMPYSTLKAYLNGKRPNRSYLKVIQKGEAAA